MTKEKGNNHGDTDDAACETAPTLGERLDLLEKLYPAPANAPKASRPYPWEQCGDFEMIIIGDKSLLRLVDVREMESLRLDHVLASIWVNQAGGSGWRWMFALDSERECVDFLCVAQDIIYCDPLSDTVTEVVDYMDSVWKLRSSVLEGLAAGKPIYEAGAPLIDSIGDCFEFLGTVRDLFTKDIMDAAQLRQYISDEDDDSPIPEDKWDDALARLGSHWW